MRDENLSAMLHLASKHRWHESWCRRGQNDWIVDERVELSVDFLLQVEILGNTFWEFHIFFVIRDDVTNTQERNNSHLARKMRRPKLSPDQCILRWSWIARLQWSFHATNPSARVFSAELRLAWVQSSLETRQYRRLTLCSRQMRRSSPTIDRWGRCVKYMN